MKLRRGFLSAVVLGTGLLLGCQGSQQGDTGDTPPGTGELRAVGLKQFESEQEFRDYFAGQVTAQNGRYADTGLPRGENSADGTAEGPVSGAPAPSLGEGGDAAPIPVGDAVTGPIAEGDAADGGFSGTTVQEAGVDESDVVKTDGTYLYILSDQRVRIVRAVPADAVSQVGEFAGLTGYGQDMYLVGDRLLVISAGPSYYTEPVLGAPVMESGLVAGDAPGYFRPRTIVTVIDVSDRANPLGVTRTAFDGSLAASRMIDGLLHMVIANYPDYYRDILPLGAPEVDSAVRSMDSGGILPKYEMIGADGATETGEAVRWERLYYPAEPDGFGMSAVISLDINQPETFTSVGIVADPGLIYSSLDALYITDTSYELDGSGRTTTAIYKFAYTATGATPASSGAVEGRILNQYSMSEHAGHLRVATTVDAFVRDDGSTDPANHVFVLADQDGKLNTVGSINGIAPGEMIYSARFVGDKGFLVTFRQVDPLFTLDLANPTSPRLVGELKVPGYSTFILPLGEDRLLTVGEDVPESGFGSNGVKLSIFDVSDFANPSELATEVIGRENGYVYSEALYNPKAFNFFASASQGDLLALPITAESWQVLIDPSLPPSDVDGSTRPGDDGVAVPPFEPYVPQQVDRFNGLYVYRITAAGFEKLGDISTESSDLLMYGSFGRGIFIGDTVYAVTDRNVTAASLDDVASVKSRIDFPVDAGRPNDGVIDPIEVVTSQGGSGSGGSSSPR